MAKVAIITDSTANISDAALLGLPIWSIPLQVIWDGKTYLDGIDIKPAEFYTRLKTAKQTPTTSQPTPEAFKRVYQELIDQGYDILTTVISDDLSGTYNSAMQAKASLPDARINIIDSRVTSMALGFPVLVGARAAQQGASLEEVTELVKRGCSASGAIFAVSTLEYLHRGGRIGGAAAFLGTALNLKPLLKIENGKIGAIERVRTQSKAIDRLVDLVIFELRDKTSLHLSSLHVEAPEAAQMLLERVMAKLKHGEIRETFVTEVSPVIGTHTGPGTVGMAYTYGI